MKLVRIGKGTTRSKTSTIQRKSTRKSPPIPRRKFGSFVRYIHRLEDLEEEARKETNLTKGSEILSERQRSFSAPSRNLRQSECLMMITKKVILLILIT